MHDILRERLMRKIESLPEDQIYQILDYIEFLEAKYGADGSDERSGLRRFAEAMEDKLRKRSMSPAKLREAFQLFSAADRVLSNVSSAGRKLMEELTPGAEDVPGKVAARPEAPAVDEPSTSGELAPEDELAPPARSDEVITSEEEVTTEADTPEDEIATDEELATEDELAEEDELFLEDELTLVDELSGDDPGADEDPLAEDPAAAH